MSDLAVEVAEARAGDVVTGGPLADWLAWGANERELRDWLRTARGPDGPFQPATRPDALAGGPRRPTVYAAEVRLDETQVPDYGELSLLLVREAVVFTNPTDRPLDVLKLRVFPNVVSPELPTRVNGVWVEGLPAPHVLQDSLLLVRLPKPLPPGGQTRLLLQLIEAIPPFRPSAPIDTVGWPPARAGVTGEADGQLALGAFLPTVTAFGAEGQDERPVGWNELPTVYDPALWHVTFTHPARFTLASTGVIVGGTADDRFVTDEVVANARDFSAHLVPDASVRTARIGGTTLRVVYRDGEGDEVGEDLLRVGEAALTTYSEWFGPPSATEIELVEGPIRGVPSVDYPGLVVVDTRHAHRPYHRSARHEWALAHGLAHQWWGHEVGNDGVAEPWIDEGLAEHSASLYWEARYGRAALVDRHEVEVLEPAGRLLARGLQLLPGNLPADAYDMGRYGVLVHGRSAMFFDGLRRSMGDERWRAALVALRAAGAGRRSTGAEVLAVFAQFAPEGVSPEALFLEQVVSPAWLEDLVRSP
jgi:hypothetical protein